MKFAHLADVHIGAWRDPLLADLPDLAFEQAVRKSLAEGVSFILIAGDLFHTALPAIDRLKATVRTLQLAKEKGVPVYVIPGSHDFSPSGKSMLHVLEEAGLLVDLWKGEVVAGKLRLQMVKDKVTGTLLAGMLGRKGMLEREHYEDLDREWLEQQARGAAQSVFLFHTSLEELRPTNLSAMEAMPLSMLPKGFSYYAGGHVHIVDETMMPGYGPVVYPGPLFPASFSELEKLRHGGFVIVEDGRPRRVPLTVKKVVVISLHVREESPAVVTERLLRMVDEVAEKDAIVLVRVSGTLSEGTSGDVDMKRVTTALKVRGAWTCLRNTAGLSTIATEKEEIMTSSPARIEEELVQARVMPSPGPFKDDATRVTHGLLRTLGGEKEEGETNTSYEERMVREAKRLLGLDSTEN
jgi:exonuclease SbcD